MDGFSWAWLAWFVAALGLEAAALIVKDRPVKPRTLTANLRWLTGAAGAWHVVARIILLGFLVWLPIHLGLLS